MKKISLFSLLLVCLLQVVFSQKDSTLKIYELPPINTPFFDFDVIEHDFSLLPLNGGLFCPEWKAWYKIPEESIFQSVSFCASDSSMIYLGGNDKGAYIIRTRISYQARLRDSIPLPHKGIFFCKKFKGDIILYGGVTSGKFAVFQHTGGTSSEIFSLNGPVTNVQFIDKQTFYFRSGNSIYLYRKGYKPNLIFRSKHTIDGFAVDKNNNLYVSRKEGIFKIMHSSVKLVLPHVHGMMKVVDNQLYVLWFDRSMYVTYRM